MITKSNIKSEVASRTGRSTAEVTDNLIKAILLDILVTIPALHSEYTAVTVVGQQEYDLSGLPLGDIVVINIDDGEPLGKISSFEAYKNLIANNTSADYKEPKYYIIEGQYLYLYPTPDAEYNLNIVMSDIDLDVEDIKLPMKYYECFVEGTAFKVYEKLGMGNKPEAQVHMQIYARLLGQLAVQFSENKFVGKTTYRDI